MSNGGSSWYGKAIPVTTWNPGMGLKGGSSGSTGYRPPSKPKPKPKGPTYSLTDPNATYKAKNLQDAIRRGLVKNANSVKKPTPPPSGHPTQRTEKKPVKPPGSTTTYKVASSTKKLSGSSVGSSSKSSSGGGSSTPAKTSSSSSSTNTTTTKAATNPYLKQAQDAVAAELNPKIKAIKDAQAAYDKSANEAQDKNQSRTKQTTHDLSYLYSNLDTKLQSQQAETQGAYANAATAVDNNYKALLDKLKNATTQNTDKINAEAQRLGLTTPVESQTAADGGFTQQLAETNRQNAALMVSAQGQNNKSTGDFLRQAEQGLGVQTSADFTKAQNNALNQLVSDQHSQDTKYQTDITNLETQRSTMEQQYLQQLEQQAYNRAQEAQQTVFMNQLALRRFNLSQDTFNANQAYREQQLALEAQRIQLAAQKASGSSSPANLNYSGANTLIDKAGSTPEIDSAMHHAFDTAMQSGEYDFNNPADREKGINGMRAALIARYPQYNTSSVMSALIQAYDTYLGKYNYA